MLRLWRAAVRRNGFCVYSRRYRLLLLENMRRDRMQHSRYELKYLITEEVAEKVRDFVRCYIALDEFGVGRPNYSYDVHSLIWIRTTSKSIGGLSMAIKTASSFASATIATIRNRRSSLRSSG